VLGLQRVPSVDEVQQFDCAMQAYAMFERCRGIEIRPGDAVQYFGEALQSVVHLLNFNGGQRLCGGAESQVKITMRDMTVAPIPSELRLVRRLQAQRL
jgi:hypothetical protein